MQRWTAVAFGLLFVGAVVLVVLQVRMPAVAGVDGEKIQPSSIDGGGDQTKPDSADAGTNLDSGPAEAGFGGSPDGGSVPRLPADAPSSVRFGVILFAYQGAQYASDDAPTKAEALRRAKEALTLAQQDFGEAVKKGDPGSTANAGRMPRGVLEPPLEYVLFTLEKGTLHDEPLDTPRGYWILRRNK